MAFDTASFASWRNKNPLRLVGFRNLRERGFVASLAAPPFQEARARVRCSSIALIEPGWSAQTSVMSKIEHEVKGRPYVS